MQGSEKVKDGGAKVRKRELAKALKALKRRGREPLRAGKYITEREADNWNINYVKYLELLEKGTESTVAWSVI